MEVISKENIISSSLEDVLHSSMMPYAEYVILDRALPRVEDGLKPVQRRIIYSMYEQAMFPDKGYKKSARVVGDCLAKYHPHGDTSVYDAMVRLAQPYNMRMTLVDGQGNFGSVDGDPPAAMRYTEVKMQPLALELTRDIEKDTVRWTPNFDDSLKEPEVLPSRFPNLLVNGATGIAVGLATNIPTHNLGEVIDGAIAYMHNPKIKLEELMKVVKGPDFPTGGIIISNGEIEKAYSTGRGKILIRATYHTEEENGKINIVLTELPYGVNKAKLLTKIDELCEKKKELFAGVASINDESDRNGMRAVIKLKKDAQVNKILDGLFKYTDMQVSFGINIVVIADGKPQQLGLIDIYRYYVEYQRNVIVKRTKYDLDRAKERAHILEGLIIAVTNIDEVIKIIKNSPDTPTARQNLRNKFGLSEKQANAILDLRLARLTKLEVDNLKQELAALKEQIKQFENILDSKKMQLHVVETEMLQIKKKYADKRRSRIVESEDQIKIVVEEDKKTVETYYVGVNVKGRIRKLSLSQYKRITEETEPLEREIFTCVEKATNEQVLLAFTNEGNCYKMDVEMLPDTRNSSAEGVKFGDLFKNAEKNEYPVALVLLDESVPQDKKLYFFTTQGMVKATKCGEYNLQKQCYQAIKLKDKDKLLSVQWEKSGEYLMFVTKLGMCLKAENEVPEQGRVAGGVKGVSLDSGDEVLCAAFIGEKAEVILGSSFGTFKKVKLDAIAPLGRARKGVRIFDLSAPAGNGKQSVMACKVLSDRKIRIKLCDLLTDADLYASGDDVPYESRTTKGKALKSIFSCNVKTLYFAEGGTK